MTHFKLLQPWKHNFNCISVAKIFDKFHTNDNNNEEKESNSNESNNASLALKEANILLARKSQEISNLRKKLDYFYFLLNKLLRNNFLNVEGAAPPPF